MSDPNDMAAAWPTPPESSTGTNMPAPKTCRNCGSTNADIYVRSLCSPCNSYQRNLGRTRPQHLWNRTPDTTTTLASGSISSTRPSFQDQHFRRQSPRQEPQKALEPGRKMRASLRCSSIASKVRYDRKSLWKRAIAGKADTTTVGVGVPNGQEVLRCIVCACTQTSAWHHIRAGMPKCNACFMYQRKHGLPRPKRLWNSSNVSTTDAQDSAAEDALDTAESISTLPGSSNFPTPSDTRLPQVGHLPTDHDEMDLREQLDRLQRHCRQQSENFRLQIDALSTENRDLKQYCQENHGVEGQTMPALETCITPLIYRIEDLQKGNNDLADQLGRCSGREGSSASGRHLLVTELIAPPARSRGRPSGTKDKAKLKNPTEILAQQYALLRTQTTKSEHERKIVHEECQELRSQLTQIEEYTAQQATAMADTEKSLRECQTLVTLLRAANENISRLTTRSASPTLPLDPNQLFQLAEKDEANAEPITPTSDLR